MFKPSLKSADNHTWIKFLKILSGVLIDPAWKAAISHKLRSQFSSIIDKFWDDQTKAIFYILHIKIWLGFSQHATVREQLCKFIELILLNFIKN
jgi:hypothetical protein